MTPYFYYLLALIWRGLCGKKMIITHDSDHKDDSQFLLPQSWIQKISVTWNIFCMAFSHPSLFFFELTDL